MIELKNVSKWYGKTQVLNNCSVNIAKGEGFHRSVQQQGYPVENLSGEIDQQEHDAASEYCQADRD